MKNKYAIIAAAAGFVIFLPSINGQFLNWDDNIYIYKNSAVMNKTGLEFVIWAFGNISAVNYHPLTMISFGIDYSIWELNPKGYHLTSLILYAFNIIVAYHVVERLLVANETIFNQQINKDNSMIAFLSVILFAAHPAHVENVVWISGRKDLLFFLFYAISVLKYLNYIETEKKSFYCQALIFYALSVLSKPMAVSLPITLIILDVYFKGTKDIKKHLYEKIPHVIITLLFIALTLKAQSSSGALEELSSYSTVEKTLNAFAAYFYYIKITLLPFGFAPIHPYHTVGALFYAKAIGGFICIGTALYVSFKKFKTNKVYLAFTIFYLVSLLPIVGIIHAGSQSVAERYFYLTSIMIFFAIVCFTYKIIFKENIKQTAALITVIFIFFTVLSVRYMPTYKSNCMLWSSQIKRYKEHSPYAYLYRGNCYFKQNKYELALKDYEVAGKYEKYSSAEMYGKMGRMYVYTGKIDKAILYSKKALHLNPKLKEVHYNLGVIYKNTGQQVLSKKHFKAAYELGEQDALAELEGL